MSPCPCESSTYIRPSPDRLISLIFLFSFLILILIRCTIQPALCFPFILIHVFLLVWVSATAFPPLVFRECYIYNPIEISNNSSNSLSWIVNVSCPDEIVNFPLTSVAIPSRSFDVA